MNQTRWLWETHCSFVIKREITTMDMNTSMPRQNGHYFADDIFKCIFFNENIWISLKISLKFVPKVRINNISALVQRMAWRRPGDKPLSEPMMVSLLTHLCVTRSQWVRVTVLATTRDVEDKLQHPQWRQWQSAWRPFRYCEVTGKFYQIVPDLQSTLCRASTGRCQNISR